VRRFRGRPLTAAGYWNGSDLSGGFACQALSFSNRYDTMYGSWLGFACSSVNNTNSGEWTNQYAVISGTGVGGAGHYAVGYYGMDYNTYEIVAPTITLRWHAASRAASSTTRPMPFGTCRTAACFLKSSAVPRATIRIG